MIRLFFVMLLGIASTASGQPAAPIGSPLLDRARNLAAEMAPEADPALGNEIGIIDDGMDALLLRVHLIRAARESIDIQTFILENDECGRLLMYELIEAAKRGVRVRLLADHFMSSHEPRWVAGLATAHPNFELKYYRPPARSIRPNPAFRFLSGVVFFRGQNQRMHNKVFLVDGVLAVMGGRNIDNHYYNHSTSYNFIDRDALIVGPALPEVRASFEAYWKYRKSVPAEKLLDVAPIISRNKAPRFESRDDFAFNGFFTGIDHDASDSVLIASRFVSTLMAADKATFLVDKPGKNGMWFLPWGGGKVTKRLREVMRGTEQQLVIQSPYLILNWPARRAFKKLHRSRPEADIIIATNSFAATDNTLAYSANYKLRSTYIQKLGFQIYEYMPRPADLLTRLPNYPDLEQRARAADPGGRHPFLCIHAKSFVRDHRTAYVGSYNIDPRSDNLNSEVGLLIEDEAIARLIESRMLACTAPDASWVIAKRPTPLVEVNSLVEGLSGLTPVDLWPLRNTTSYELKPGAEPVSPEDPNFYKNYEDVGSFPGADGVSTKQIVTYIYKVFNTLAIPVL